MITLYRALTAAGCFLVLTAVGRAHEGATGVAKERMDLMGDMSQRMKDVSKRLNANRDLAAIAADANRIQELTPRIAELFPKGSETGITDAKPAIWQQWDQFVGDAKALGDAAQKLAMVAKSGDPRAIGDQYRTVAKTCIACHDTFRRGRADRL